jgi:hypothetical protein
MRNAIRTTIALMLMLGLQAERGGAQEIDSPYRFLTTRQSINAYGGYLATGTGTLGLGPESGPVFGVRYGIAISGPFSLEGDVGYFSSTRAVMDTVPGDTSRQQVGEADFTAFLATGSLRFNLTGPRTWHGIQPYVKFGAGIAVEASGGSAVDEDLPGDVRFDFGTGFTGVLGGGIDWFAGERWGIRLDARNLLWKLGTPRAFLIKGEQARLLPADEWAQNFALTASLVLRF